MSDFVNKINITKEILNILNSPITFEHAIFSWWIDKRNNQTSLGLTKQGFAAFKSANQKLTTIKLPENLIFTSRLIVDLQQFMSCPYYTTSKTISLFGDKESVWLTMLDGDIINFIKNWKPE